MKQLSVLLASGALIVSAPAVSTPVGNWSKLAESATGSIFSLDVDSIESSDINIIDEKRGKNITVSIRITYPTQKTDAQDNNTQENNAQESNAQESNAQTTKDHTLHHSYQQLLLSCKNTSYYRRAYVNYDTDNKVIKSWQSKKSILTTKDFTIASPKTMGRMIIDQACRDHESTKPKA